MPDKGDTTSTHSQGAIQREKQVCLPVPSVTFTLGGVMGRWQGPGNDCPFVLTPPTPPLLRGPSTVNPTAKRRGKMQSLHKLHPADLSQGVRWPPRQPAGQGLAQRQRAGVTLL